MALIFLQILLIFTFVFGGRARMSQSITMMSGKYRRCKSLRIIAAADTINDHGGTHHFQPKLREAIKRMQNVYAWNNFEIRIQGIEYWIQGNEIKITNNWAVTLDNLATHYSSRFFHHNLRHPILLFTSTKDTITNPPEVGLAYLLSECLSRAVGLVLALKRDSPDGFATTAAHEFGHIIGLEHVENSDKCSCPFKEGCIMHPYTFQWNEPRYPPAFHSCSAIKLIEHTNLCEEDCSKGGSISNTCGSGVLIANHNLECNCGPREVCAVRNLDTCCDATTCKLKPHSECSVEECCVNCHYRAGILCREKKDYQCDIAEFCVGHQPKCQIDAYIRNGERCGRAGVCYDGFCTDKDYLCQRMLNDVDAKYSKRCERKFFSMDKREKCYRVDINSLSNTDRFICLYTHSCLPIVCETKNPIGTSVSGVIFNSIYSQTDNYECIFHDRIDYEAMNGLSCGHNRICVNGICDLMSKHIVQCPRCPSGTVCNNYGRCVLFL